MNIMTMIEAATKLNDTWNKCTSEIEKENLSADVYNCACEIDEAIIALVEKIGNCTKAITISKMYGKSPLAESHKTIIARDNIQLKETSCLVQFVSFNTYVLILS